MSDQLQGNCKEVEPPHPTKFYGFRNGVHQGKLLYLLATQHNKHSDGIADNNNIENWNDNTTCDSYNDPNQLSYTHYQIAFWSRHRDKAPYLW